FPRGARVPAAPVVRAPPAVQAPPGVPATPVVPPLPEAPPSPPVPVPSTAVTLPQPPTPPSPSIDATDSVASHPRTRILDHHTPSAPVAGSANLIASGFRPGIRTATLAPAHSAFHVATRPPGHPPCLSDY